MGNNPLDDEPCRPIFWQDEIDALLLRKVCRSANQSAVWSLEPGFQQPACLAQGRGAADEGDQLDTLKEMQGAVATEGEYDSASRNISGTNLAQTPVLDDGNALTPPAIESLNGVLSPAQLCRDEEMNVEMDMAPAENTFPFKDSKKIKEGPEATSISGWSLSLDSSESADECSEDESALRKAAFGGSPAAGGTAHTRGTRSAIIGFQSLQSVAQKALASAGAQAGAVASNFEAQAVDAGTVLQLRAAAALEGIAERARKARLRAEAAWLESRNRGHESAWLLFSPCVPESIRSLPCSKALLSGPGGETGITEEVTSAEASRDSADTEASGEEGHAMLQGTRESTASGCLVLEPFCLSLGNPLTIMLGTFAAGASHAESGLLIATEQVKPAASAALDAAWAVDEAFMSAVRALDDALASGWAMIEAFGHKSMATLGVVVGDMIPGEKRNLTRVGTQSSGERDGDRGVVVRSKHRGRSNYNSAPSGTEAHVPESVCGEDNIDTLQKMRITPSMVSWMPVAERPASAAVGYTENDAAGLFSDTESWTGAMARAAAALEGLAGHSTKVTRHSEGSATPGVIAQCVEAEAWSELAKGGAHGTCLPWGHRERHVASGINCTVPFNNEAVSALSCVPVVLRGSEALAGLSLNASALLATAIGERLGQLGVDLQYRAKSATATVASAAKLVRWRLVRAGTEVADGTASVGQHATAGALRVRELAQSAVMAVGDGIGRGEAVLRGEVYAGLESCQSVVKGCFIPGGLATEPIRPLQRLQVTPSMVSWMPVAERPASAAVGYTENDAAGLFSDTESWTGAMARAAAALEGLAGHSTKVTRHSEGSATPGVIAQCVEAEAWSELAKGGAHGTCLPWGHRKKHRAAGQHSSTSPVMADSASAGGARDQCGSQNWFRWQKSRVTNRLFVVAWNVVKWTRSGLRRPLRQESQLPPSMVVCAPACLMKVCSQPEPNQAAAGTVSLDVQVGATEPALSLATVARIPLPGSTLQARQALQLKKSPRGYVLVFKKAEKRCNFKNSTVEPTASRESPLQVFNPD